MNYEEASNLLIMCSSFDRFQTFLKIKDELNDIDYWRTVADTYTGSDNLYHLKEEVKESFPEYSNELRGIVNRLKDLMIPFQQKWYYTPEMRGSYSIKSVLPALVLKLSYNDLEIKEGGTASNTFLSMVNETFEGDVEETRKLLLEYCELDTFAMVKILEKLLQV